MLMRLELNLSSLTATEKFATTIGSHFKGSEVLSLNSDLGGGKTTIIKSLVKGSGSKDLVSSPTFTICNTYKAGKLTIYHFDFYRLSDPGIISRELAEAVQDKLGVTLIEWPAIIESILPPNAVHINIAVTGENSRKISVDYPEQSSYLFKGLEGIIKS